MSQYFLFFDIIILLNISLTLEGHMTCLHKPLRLLYLVTHFDYVIFYFS